MQAGWGNGSDVIPLSSQAHLPDPPVSDHRTSWHGLTLGALGANLQPGGGGAEAVIISSHHLPIQIFSSDVNVFLAGCKIDTQSSIPIHRPSTRNSQTNNKVGSYTRGLRNRALNPESLSSLGAEEFNEFRR